ncbi:MAG: hypothetical protein JJ975_09200 [Bacteroidia bacterium]|nr:hypothetical protein [Bacteroidia bacterium]
MNRHSKHERFTYHSELWADKAGYHMFLPALFYYNFEAGRFPDDIQRKIGTGFRVQKETNKVISKYPIGVAVLHSPFFVMGMGIEALWPVEPELGYTTVQHKMVLLSTIFYLTLALFMLFRMLVPTYSRNKVYLLLFLLVFGSNLYFYITRDAGLSHAYSFFTFSLFYYYLERWLNSSILRKKYLAAAVFFASLGCLIRPSNVVFYLVVALLFLLPHGRYIWKNRFVALKGLSVAIPIALILPLLQLVYYKYAYGDYFTYSYTDESFIYAIKPRFARVWFAPGNGLFLYSPVFALALFGVVTAFKDKPLTSFLYLLVFFTVSYIYAAWWTPGLGCGYGHRGFIELLPIFCVPILTGISSIKPKTIKMVSGVLGFCLIVFLVYFQYRYDGCWYGNGYWDWAEIPRILNLY